MKKLLVIIFLLIAGQSFSQQNTVSKPQPNDSLTAVIKKELNIPKSKADSLVSILNWSSNEIGTIVHNKLLTKEQKNSEIAKIAAGRNQKIEMLLTRAQIEKLKAVMAANKQKMKAKQQH
jgi:hypothetical protein